MIRLFYKIFEIYFDTPIPFILTLILAVGGGCCISIHQGIAIEKMLGARNAIKQNIFIGDEIQVGQSKGLVVGYKQDGFLVDFGDLGEISVINEEISKDLQRHPLLLEARIEFLEKQLETAHLKNSTLSGLLMMEKERYKSTENFIDARIKKSIDTAVALTLGISP